MVLTQLLFASLSGHSSTCHQRNGDGHHKEHQRGDGGDDDDAPSRRSGVDDALHRARHIPFPFLFVSFLHIFFRLFQHLYARYKKWGNTDIIIGPVETTPPTTEMSENGASEKGEERGNDDDDDDEVRFASKLAPFVQNGTSECN